MKQKSFEDLNFKQLRKLLNTATLSITNTAKCKKLKKTSLCFTKLVFIAFVQLLLFGTV